MEILAHIGGALTDFILETPDDVRIRDYVIEQYMRAAVCVHTPELVLDGDGRLIHTPAHPENGIDPPLVPLLVFCRNKETVYIYQHAFIAFKESGEKDYITRMD